MNHAGTWIVVGICLVAGGIVGLVSGWSGTLVAGLMLSAVAFMTA